MADHNISLVDRTDDESSPERIAVERLETQTSNPTPDSHIDILYENQRGWFVFGIPLFSANALWNLRVDQAPWVDAKFKRSPVNITNAQVPDPSWVWEWKSWYVDMSQDVDEEGWQYSIWFRGAAWHGNHPWFHSFVRRRRWLRKRVKQKLPPKTKSNKERMFGETFSIGTTVVRALAGSAGPASNEDTTATSLDEEIRNVPTLLQKLKRAAIDREKIVLINRFIEEGGEELYYLAEQIPTIMSLLIFQNSRRQLLSTLMETIDDARDQRDTNKKSATPENGAEERRINHLLKAVEAADAECKKLEYWSDIRKLAEEGNAGNATDARTGWDETWQGVDSSGAGHPRQPPKAEA